MSFLYPRSCSIARPSAQTGDGIKAYGGKTQAAEPVIKGPGLRCNIQLRREGQSNPVKLPGDGNRPTYDVRFPRNSPLALGDVKDRDILIDDLGQRFMVLANYWDSFGYALRVERLEA